ncbi:hypothetical protein WME94_54505 [Sorangium sp. So ce429]
MFSLLVAGFQSPPGREAVKDEDRDERGGRETGAGAPASPAKGASPPAGHPAFQTGVVYVEPELRDEVQAYRQAYATWERTRQGPPPQAPQVSVRVDHGGKPSAAAQLREAMAPNKAAPRGGGEKGAGEKSAGGSPWAADAGTGAAVIDKSALPPAHRLRSEAAEEKNGDETEARPGKARRAGTAMAALALAAGIGAAAMCGVKEPAPAESPAGASDAAVSGAASNAAVASGAPSDAAASDATSSARTQGAPPAVAKSALVGAPPEAPDERAAPAAASDRNEAVRAARRTPPPATDAQAPKASDAQTPKRQPSPEKAPKAPVAPAAPGPAPIPSPGDGGDQPRPTSEPHVFQLKPKY